MESLKIKLKKKEEEEEEEYFAVIERHSSCLAVR